MKKLALVMFTAGSLSLLGFASMTPDVAAGKDCARKEFKTKLVKDACKKGGQATAKKVMKKFLKDAKKKTADLSCKSCHTKLSPDYPLKKDGLKMFKDHGGK